jgi:GNAT superfamily N-acetyltransferase
VIRLERVDPYAFAEPASRILQEAWPPPTLRFSADYLRWQFSFPGPLPPLGVIAFDGDEPVGFVGMTPRRLRFRGHSGPAYLHSFGGVRPAWRGRGVAAELYAALLLERREPALPIVGWVEEGAGGHRTLTRAASLAGFEVPLPTLGANPVYGYRPGRADSGDPLLEVVEDAEGTAFLEVARRCGAPDTIWNDPDEVILEHYRRDPRGRVFIVVRGADGEAVGAAMLLHAEVVTARQLDRVATVDAVFLPRPNLDTLSSVLRFTARRWAPPGRPSVVSAPSLWTVPVEVRHAAGLRRMAKGFQGQLEVPSRRHPYASAEGTNLEIV